MPHIHTEPGQHDITTSAWIFREDPDELRMLVHMHRKHGKLMQVGGHIELDETPWQTIAHEVPEESGLNLSDLYVLQPLAETLDIAGASVHPVPAVANTHAIGGGHYHSDFGYAFIVKGDPELHPAEGESSDLRWLTVGELGEAAVAGLALQDVVDIYAHIAKRIVPVYHKIEATEFTTGKPDESLMESSK